MGGGHRLLMGHPVKLRRVSIRDRFTVVSICSVVHLYVTCGSLGTLGLAMVRRTAVTRICYIC